MPNERLAEAVLAIVAPPAHAAATVGDLLELMPARGRRWFWKSVVATALATVWRQFRAAPWLLTSYAAVACAGYVVVVMLLIGIVFVPLEILWLGGEVLTHHSRFAPLAHALGLGGEWGDLPQPVVRLIFFLIEFVAAPYLAGRRVADVWKDRGVALTMAMVVVWLLMLALSPVGSYFGRDVRVPMLLPILPFMLAGTVRGRLIRVRQSHAPVAG